MSFSLFPARTLAYTPPSPRSHHCHIPGFHPGHLKSYCPQDLPPNQAKLFSFLQPLLLLFIIVPLSPEPESKPSCHGKDHAHSSTSTSAFGTEHPGHGMFANAYAGLSGPQKKSLPRGQSPHAMPQSSLYCHKEGGANSLGPSMHSFPECRQVLVHRTSHKVSTDTVRERERRSVRSDWSSSGKQSPCPLPLPRIASSSPLQKRKHARPHFVGKVQREHSSGP